MKNLILLLFIPFIGFAQPNCNVYLYEGDTLQYNACKLSENFNNYYQFETKGLAILDSCITMCPHYAYAYYEKAVVYLKAGNFVMYEQYMADAIKYAPTEYLSNRASCRGKFFADYIGAINDIDRLDSMVTHDLGYIHDGAYHLDAYRALCYKALGSYNKAIDHFEVHLAERPNDVGLYDLIHLGVCYYKMGNYEKAITNLKKQEGIYNLAENHFYLAKCYQALGKKELAKSSMQKAFAFYKKDQKMTNGYNIMEDEIFLLQIEEELSSPFFNQ